MDALLVRLAGPFAAHQPDGASRVATVLVALLVVAAAPLISWAYAAALWRPAPKPQEAAAPGDAEPQRLQLPTPEQTATLIAKRRSIWVKDLNKEPVERSTIERLLEAANWAPTHGVTEPWRFHPMAGAKAQAFADVTLQALEESNLPDKARRAACLRSRRAELPGVPWTIAICYKRQPLPHKRNPAWEELAATACAVQNFHLLATAMGLGVIWSSWAADCVRDAACVKAWLGLGPEDACLGVLYVGCTDRAGQYRASRRPIAEKVTWHE